MTNDEARAEWARLLRGVAAGDVSPAEALAKRPVIARENDVPKAYWSAVMLLELEVEHGLDIPEAKSYFASEVLKLADRIEGVSRIP